MACEIRRRKIDGAINFTASHNPAEYHGLKFSAADGGPALPEVTRDIEARAARLYARTAERKASAFPSPHDAGAFEQVDIAPPYLAQLAELVRFAELKTKTAPRIVYDALHGCGAGYLDRALAEHGISGCETIRAERDVLFEGSGPDVSESNLKLLSETVVAHKAAQRRRIGLATDGDADRFGIVDARRAPGFRPITFSACSTTTSSKAAAGSSTPRAAWPLRICSTPSPPNTAAKFTRRRSDSSTSAS